MDIHLHNNTRLHYGLNGCHQAPHSKDDGLQFLSLEEKECILFFEETIDSLGEDLEDDNIETSLVRTTSVEYFQPSSGPTVPPISTTSVPCNMTEHDIIDLVQTTSNFSVPDFQNLATPPESHIEIKSKRDPAESVFSDFPDSAKAVGSGVPEDSSHQPPSGSVPTPVVIASKIAEHQGGPVTSPSALLECRSSLESKRSPPTHAKPARLPDNISVKLGGQEPSPHSIALEAVTAQERRSQMLSSLPASVHPLDGGEPACVRNLPTRSVSFSDPTPDKSRMEALSKLGLTRGKMMSVTTPAASTKMESNAKKTSSPPSTASSNSRKPTDMSTTPVSTSSDVPVGQNKNSSSSVTVTPYSQSSKYEPKTKSDVAVSNFNSYGVKSAAVSPTKADTVGAGNGERRPSFAKSPGSAEVTHNDFNSYGGKSIMLNPSLSLRAEPSSISGQGVKPEPSEIHLNSYGGRSRVIHPPPVHADPPPVPAGRPRSNSHSPSNTLIHAKQQSELPSPTGVRSKIFPPAKTDSQNTSVHLTSRNEVNSPDTKPSAVRLSHPDPVSQPISRTRLATAPPTLTPRPQRPSGSMSAHKSWSESLPSETRNKPAPKASFRTQGITVQFSGKGATDEARRDALRKLGLLKNT